MVRRYAKVGVVGMVLGLSAMVALAATAYSSWGYYSVYGYNYKNQAAVSNDGRLWAGTDVYAQDMSTVPTGYMGVQSRLYKSDVLCDASAWMYNSSASAGIGNSTDSGCGSGIYYSKGQSSAYNGNGYTVYWTYQSPNINN